MRNPSDLGTTTAAALSRLLMLIAPWLVEVGAWFFGGLIALNLIVVAALIPVGPADTPILIAFTAFACALPFEVAGLILLKLKKDFGDVQLADMTLQSFEAAHFPNIRTYFPLPHQQGLHQKRRTRIVLAYALAFATMGFALTLTGVLATLWHIAPWIAGVALVAGFAAVALMVIAGVHAMPPVSDAERLLQSRRRRKRAPAADAPPAHGDNPK